MSVKSHSFVSEQEERDIQDALSTARREELARRLKPLGVRLQTLEGAPHLKPYPNSRPDSDGKKEGFSGICCHRRNLTLGGITISITSTPLTQNILVR